MKQITINLYTYSELPKEVQDKVLKDFLEINLDYDWWDDLYKDAENIGLKIDEFDIYRRYIRTTPLLDLQDIASLIIKNHGKTCDTTFAAKEYLSNKNDSLFSKSLEKEYLKMLVQESEERLSEEWIVDTIESNDYYFTKDGELFKFVNSQS